MFQPQPLTKIIFNTYLVREKYELCYILSHFIEYFRKNSDDTKLEKYYVVFLEHLPI